MTDVGVTPAEIVVTQHLLPGERVLWADRPVRGIRLSPSDAVLIPFALLWTAIVVLWEVLALRILGDIDGGVPFAVVGVPFLLVGLYLVAGRLVVGALRKRRLLYAVTDQRVLVLREGEGTRARSVALERLGAPSATRGSDGRGTVRFGGTGPTLVDVPDVQRVLHAVEGARRHQGRST
jgi:hypothetical protein